MKTPEQLKPALWGAAGGAAALAIVGFVWGGWMLESSAKKMAVVESNKAVISALAPVCASIFAAQPDAAAKRVALEKADTYDRRKLVSLPGQAQMERDAAEACVDLIRKKPAAV